MGCHFLLQGILLTQGLNLYLLHWQAYSLPLHHLGSPSKHLTTCYILKLEFQSHHWKEVDGSSTGCALVAWALALLRPVLEVSAPR